MTLRRECAPDGSTQCAPDRAADDGLPCSDPCTTGGSCLGGECVGATPVVCDDGDGCTTDRCDPVSGCVQDTIFTPMCCDLGVERLGGANLFGRGRINDLRVVGDLAYLAAGRVGVHIYNIRDPAGPTQVGWVDTPGDATTLEVQAGMIYVGDRATGDVDTARMRVIDATDPSQPRLVGSADPQYLIKGIGVQGDYAYVANFGGELRVVDVSDPRAPTTVGAVSPVDPRHWDAWSLQVQGDRAYVLVSGSPGALEVYDIADPTAPTLVGSAPAFAYPHGLFVHKDRAYVSQYGHLKVFDIGAEPPRELVDLGGDFGRAPFVDDTNLYIAGSRGFRTYDAIDPRPTLLATRSTPDDTQAVRVHRGFAFVGIGEGAPLILNPVSGGFRSAEGGLWTYDVSDPAAPTRVSVTFTPGASHSVVTRGRHAYIADLGGGLRIFDVSNPARPTEAGRLTFDTLPYVVALAGDRLVMGVEELAASRVEVYDLETPTRPRLLGSTTLEGTEIRLKTDGARIYATTRDVPDYMARLHIIDIGADGTLAQRGHLDPGRYEGDVAPHGDRVYMSGEMLRTIDVSNPDAPTIVATGDRLPSSVTLAIDGDTLVGTAGASTSRLWIWDVGGDAPALKGQVEFPLPGTKTVLRGGFALVANGVHGVRAFDVTDPAAPRDLGSFPTVGNAWGLDLAGDNVYIADTYGMLQTGRLVCR